jgi:isoleucyl-tRNA synthetase
VARKVLRDYEDYEYGPISQALTQFVTVDLSSFYNDISKDGLYTLAPASKERRSAQTALYIMADGLTRLLAPILSFTADELWRYLPGRREGEESVHLALFPAVKDLDALADQALVDEWDALVRLRERVLEKIEPLRKEKKIGSSLQAEVILTAGGRDLERVQKHSAQLPMLFIVSSVKIEAVDNPTPETAPVQIRIERASGVKCERCWRIVPAVSAEPASAGLCDRCQDALAETDHG